MGWFMKYSALFYDSRGDRGVHDMMVYATFCINSTVLEVTKERMIWWFMPFFALILRFRGDMLMYHYEAGFHLMLKLT